MSLYLEHFGLCEPPFRITPHTDFFFTGANRGPTLDALIYAITQDEGIVKVSGEVGSGKTMLCRMLLERLPAQVETLYLANPSLSREEILGAIADELALPATGGTTHSRLRALQEALVERYAQGRRVVLLIDEAHAMPAESLEEIRLLSNLEAKSAKLLQIVLFAQPELDSRLAANDMRQLRERITQHFDLMPLPLGEIGQYIEFRLRAAGYRGPQPFTPAAIELIAHASEGLSRRINILADKALLAAYSTGQYQVDTSEARTAIQDARFTPIQPITSTRRPGLAITLGAGLAALAMAGVFLYSRPAAEAPPAPSPQPAVSAAPAASEPAVPERDAFGARTRQALAAYTTWAATASSQRYFLQLFATDAGQAGDVEDLLSRTGPEINGQPLRAYRSALSGKDRIGLIVGDYPNRVAAASAVATLPAALRNLRPYPRQLSKLR